MSGSAGRWRLTRQCNIPPDIGRSISTIAALSALVSEAIDVVVHCSRQGGHIRVTEVLAVEDLQVAAGTVAFTTTTVFSRSRHAEDLRWSGNLPVRAARALELHGYELRSLVRGEGPL